MPGDMGKGNDLGTTFRGKAQRWEEDARMEDSEGQTSESNHPESVSSGFKSLSA